MRWSAASLLCTAIALFGAASAQAQSLAVHIVTPDSGVVHGPVVDLEATVSSPEVDHATLVVNGAAYDVPVEQGRVRQQIVAIPGNNRVALLVQDGSQSARDSLTFRYDGPPMELVVLLTWPSEGEIIDLWVREPGGETCKWDHRSTESGGRLLDFSADAIGFGSQGYTQSEVRAGAYRLKIHYWGGAADDDQRSWWSFDRLLRERDQIVEQLAGAAPTERRNLQIQLSDLEARMDQWARPAATQTPVRAEVILFPGTPHERRWRFRRTVTRTGELVTLGEIEISDLMIRRARAGETP